MVSTTFHSGHYEAGVTSLSLGHPDVPGQKLFDSVDGMVGNPRKYRRQISLGIDSIQPCRSDQAIHCSGAFAASIGAHKKEVLPAQSDGSQCTLGGIVVDFQPTVI